MNFYAVQLPCCAETVVIDDFAAADVHCGDGFHFSVRQNKVECAQIFFHPVFVQCAGYNGDAALAVPAEDDLRDGFFVFFHNF